MGSDYRRTRESSGISLEDAAMHLGISAKTLRHYENGETYPSACTLIAMCGLYHCSADSLLGIPHSNLSSMSLDEDEFAIIEHYRECNRQWKKTIAMTAQSCATVSKKCPNVLYLPPRDSHSIGTV